MNCESSHWHSAAQDGLVKLHQVLEASRLSSLQDGMGRIPFDTLTLADDELFGATGFNPNAVDASFCEGVFAESTAVVPSFWVI
jgi:hypothetical protein